MSQPKGAKAYQTAAVTSAGRGQVLLMLYEGAIKNCKLAITALDQNDRGTKGIYIGKAHDIINELSVSLDFNIGGEIARDLERLYNFMIELLMKANVENSKEPITHVLKLLETLYDGWRQAVEKAKSENVIKG